MMTVEIGGHVMERPTRSPEMSLAQRPLLQEMEVVILCGGRGIRMQHELPNIPKPLVEVGERPILWHIMRLYAHAGVHRFLLCLGYKAGQIEALFDKRVLLPSGGSIIVEPTESMVAIDVNTGKFTGRRNLEDTAFQVDKEAAVEVARQLRLRDIGGIVVIDFIDLDVPAHRRELVKVLEEALSRDRAKTNLISFSDICLAELTRQRMRRSVETVSHQTCPYCGGRGTVKSVVTMAIEAIRQAKRTLKTAPHKTLELLVHPQVAMRLLQEDRPSLSALEQQAKAKVLVLSDPSLHLEQIKVQVGAS